MSVSLNKFQAHVMIRNNLQTPLAKKTRSTVTSNSKQLAPTSLHKTVHSLKPCTVKALLSGKKKPVALHKFPIPRLLSQPSIEMESLMTTFEGVINGRNSGPTAVRPSVKVTPFSPFNSINNKRSSGILRKASFLSFGHRERYVFNANSHVEYKEQKNVTEDQNNQESACVSYHQKSQTIKKINHNRNENNNKKYSQHEKIHNKKAYNYWINFYLSLIPTKDQKKYSILTQNYKTSIAASAKRIPKVDYSGLLSVINNRIGELNDTETRLKNVRKRRRGRLERRVWNLEQIADRVERTHLNNVEAKRQQQIIVGIEEMDSNKVRELIREQAFSITKKPPPPSIQDEFRGQTHKNSVLLHFKLRVERCIETIKNEYCASLNDWSQGKILSMNPFEKAYSRPYFTALIARNAPKVVSYLNKNPFLIYDINLRHQTCLHIIAKTNDRSLLRTLVSSHAYLNAVDYMHRTPLYLAVKHGHSEVAIKLLSYGANPLIECKRGFRPSQITTDNYLEMVLKQAEKAHVALNFVYSVKKQKETLKFFKDIALSPTLRSNLFNLFVLMKKGTPEVIKKKNFLQLVREAQTHSKEAKKEMAISSSKVESIEESEDESDEDFPF